MAFIPALNVAMCSLRYTVSGQQAENTLYFEFASDPDEAALQDISGYLVTWRDTYLKEIQGLHCLFREVYAVSMTTGFSPTFTNVVSPEVAGTYTGTPLPNNVTLAISFRTSGRGKSSRGRNYALGLTESSLSSTLGQSVQTTYAADLVAAYNALFVGLPTDWTWVIISRSVNGAPRANALITPVQSVILTDLTIDSQRRRLPGRGA